MPEGSLRRRHCWRRIHHSAVGHSTPYESWIGLLGQRMRTSFYNVLGYAGTGRVLYLSWLSGFYLFNSGVQNYVFTRLGDGCLRYFTKQKVNAFTLGHNISPARSFFATSLCSPPIYTRFISIFSSRSGNEKRIHLYILTAWTCLTLSVQRGSDRHHRGCCDRWSTSSTLAPSYPRQGRRPPPC